VSSAREITPEEQNAINTLVRLGKRWPPTLKLFSWSGCLVVFDVDIEPSNETVLAIIPGIINDGGDP
jgi:hypothetical protein